MSVVSNNAVHHNDNTDVADFCSDIPIEISENDGKTVLTLSGEFFYRAEDFVA